MASKTQLLKRETQSAVCSACNAGDQ